MLVSTASEGYGVTSVSLTFGAAMQIANDTPYPIRLSGVLDAPAAAAVEDLGRNLRLVPQAVAGGRQLVLDLLALRGLGDPGRRPRMST